MKTNYQLYTKKKLALWKEEKLFKVNPFIDKNTVTPVRCNLIQSAKCGVKSIMFLEIQTLQ